MVTLSSKTFHDLRTIPTDRETPSLLEKKGMKDPVQHLQGMSIANPSVSAKRQLQNKVELPPKKTVLRTVESEKLTFWKKAFVYASIAALTIGVLKKFFSESDICTAVVAANDYSKQYLIADMPTNGDYGMYSVFLYLLGIIHEYESKGYGGLEINFGKAGQYYDPQHGENWWNNYLETVKIGDGKAKCQKSHVEKYADFAMGVEENFQGTGKGMSRERGHEIVKKYFKLKSNIQKKIDDFFENNLKGKYVISVHYRGTDKVDPNNPWNEAHRVEYEKMSELIQKYIDENKLTDFKIFAASDEQGFIDFIQEKFTDKVSFIDTERSRDGKALHRNGKKPYLTGEGAILDGWLLATGKVLIRTSSNFSFFPKFINPKIQVIEASSRKGR